MNQLNFDEQVLQSELPVLVDYWAECCAPCKAMAQVNGVRANKCSITPLIYPSRSGLSASNGSAGAGRDFRCGFMIELKYQGR